MGVTHFLLLSCLGFVITAQEKSCGHPGEVQNGQIDFSEGVEFGSKIVIICNDGFVLAGKKELHCGDQGWIGRLPVCAAVTCDPPPTVDNGNFSPVKEVYEYGDVVHYSCQRDFTLSGSKSINCSGDGTFKSDPPTCIKVQCEDHDVPNADWIHGSRPPYGYQATVTYKCRSGYKMNGEPTAICDINSQWSPELPQCKPVTCDPPPAVANGTFSPNKDVYEYPEVVSYSCDTGFTLTGSTSGQCSADGTFKPDPPTCILVQCEDPDIPNADWIHGSRPPH